MTTKKQTRKKSQGAVKKQQKPTLTASEKTAPAPENRRITGASSFGVTVPPEVGRSTQFKPGESGNPGGRPKSHGLLDMLRAVCDEVREGRTVKEALVETLITEALQGHNRLGAIQTVFDRLEGRPKQAIDFNDITAAMANRSPEDLVYYAEKGTWPEDESTAVADASEGSEQHES
jgi:uncharacterized protein DUF5681